MPTSLFSADAQAMFDAVKESTGAAAKLVVARVLGLPVILIDRPVVPARATAASVDQVMAWLAVHVHGTDRGV